MKSPGIHATWFSRPKTFSSIPVLFIHGFLGESSDWEPIASRLDAPSFGIDLPGHGLSPALTTEEPWFLPTCKSIRGVLEKAGYPKYDVVGYSLGGRIAMHLSKECPGLIRNLVIESSHPGLQSTADRQERLESDRKWAEHFATCWPGVLEDWYQQRIFHSLKDRLPELMEGKQSQNPAALARAMIGFSLGRQDSLWDLGHRSLFVAGEYDPKYVDIGRNLTRISPKTSLNLVKRAGHNVHLERPEAYLRSIHRFLKQDPT